MGQFVQRTGWVLGGLVAMTLAACDPPSLLTPGVTPAVSSADLTAPLTPPDAHYAALPDNGFTVPAVPVDKVDPEMLRQEVAYPSSQPPGTIIIDPSSKHLYLITQKGQALRYGIAVGRSGFGWSGEADITGRTNWPIWTPPPEMIVRRPELAKYSTGQPGGLENPLGARALYLKTNGVDYGYRIHGTPEWNSIGTNASSGCIRMINQDVIDLYQRAPDGTHVVVLTEAGAFPDKLSVPKPGPSVAGKPKPAVSKAAVSKPALPDPAVSQPALPDPAVSQPALPDPALPNPALPNPPLPNPPLPNPPLPNPPLPNPPVTDPAVTDTAVSDPALH